MQNKNRAPEPKAASTRAFARPLMLLVFVAAAMVAPFLLFTTGGRLSNNLPWYFWGATLLLLLAVILVGFMRFARVSTDAEEISISPDRH